LIPTLPFPTPIRGGSAGVRSMMACQVMCLLLLSVWMVGRCADTAIVSELF
jgi:hypothetical protein